MNKEINFQRASRLRASAHEMLQLADEIEEKFTIRQNKIMAYEFASLTALAAYASKALANRQRRAACFEEDLFGEPVWDMLLYLFVNAVEKKRVRKTGVASVSGVSHATALRYLGIMIDRKLVQIDQCRSDNRVQFVTLTHNGMARMSSCLERMLRREHGVESITALQPEPRDVQFDQDQEIGSAA